MPRQIPRKTNGKTPKNSKENKPKPLKRPQQARSTFTVQVLYDAFVRIWVQDGWDKMTTREIAAESGFAVGTIYEYFPNKTALLSGYVRHYVDALIKTLKTDIEATSGQPWAERTERLVAITLGYQGTRVPHLNYTLPYFDRDMLLAEDQIAELKHHARVLDELVAVWDQALRAMPDLPASPDPHALRAILQILWGTRRYVLLTENQDGNDGAEGLDHTPIFNMASRLVRDTLTLQKTS